MGYVLLSKSLVPSLIRKDVLKIEIHFFFERSNLARNFSKSAGPSGRAVYGRSPAEILGSNPTGGMDVCLF